jgi:hypothetical protein
MKILRRISIFVVVFGVTLILADMINSRFDPTAVAVNEMIIRELPIGSTEQAAEAFLNRHHFMESWPGANTDAAPTVHVGPRGPEMWGQVEYRTYLWLVPHRTGVICRFSPTGHLTSYKVEAVGVAP